ncbi:MAG: hypothetical protein Q9217_005205 [Psora testacea]
MNGPVEREQQEDVKVSQHSQILQALNAIHDPRSSNELRHEASNFLEQVKPDENAPHQGFLLATSRGHSPIVRHFGLSLIEYAIHHSWADYTREQCEALRGWVLQLAQACSDQDPSYLTNKVAALWVETAKRSWAIDWMDMDELLVRLWNVQTAQKVLVLIILETLSDEIFATEDSVAALRGSDLNRACIDIFIPLLVLSEQFPTRESSINVRHGSEGWVSRLSEALDDCTNQSQLDRSRQTLALRILSTFKSIIGWVIPKALVSTFSVRRICACMAVSDMAVQLAAIDTLYALYNRSRFSEDDFKDIVGPMFRPETIALLRQLYEWLQVDPTDIDGGKYLMLKKLSETLFNLGRLLGERPSYLPEGSDLAGFVNLLISVMKNDSLQISIPALHLWVKFLHSEMISKSPAVQAVVGDLLETCSHRLVRYEALPQGTTNPSIIFLNEDIETMPERHAFLGNYARFCNQVIELVVQQQPIDALYHILGQADQMLNHLYDAEPPFIPSAYSKHSIPWLKTDAQFTVIEAALKGCLKWLTSADNATVIHEHEVMTSNLRTWCDRLLGLIFEDPLIKERVIQLAVGFAVGPLKSDPQFAVRVFDHVLETRCPSYPQCTAYTDAVKDLQVFATHQLQRLAMRFADHLVTIFDVVERKVVAISEAIAFDEQTKARYTSVLFVIMHRATKVDRAPREARLEQYLSPLIAQWQDEALRQSLSSFEAFSQRLGLGNLQQYFISRSIRDIAEWSAHSLDDEGKSIQTQMQTAIDSLPLRPTKHLMGVSVEKLERDTQPYEIACHLWQKYIPVLLPTVLAFISQAQALYDPENWTSITPELKSVVRRIFTDRFWQVGISRGTRDDFYASIGGTKATLEGFASSIRATMRMVRESGYRLLYYMSHLGEHFYGLQELPELLAKALFNDACALSPHQMALMIDTMRPIIDNCPKGCRGHFLPPVLSALFEQVDRKASSEWDRIEQRKSAATDDDDLASEMKDESVLRQLTLSSVMLVAGLLEPATLLPQTEPNTKSHGTNHRSSEDSTRDFVLQTPQVLKSLILFCTHALRMRDTRACSLIARVIRTIISDFAGDTPLEADAREFISTEVLKACITSLNDPYFVEMQKEFAQLIASIFITYTPRTETPKQVVLTLPGVTNDKVDRAIRHLFRAQTNFRQQRAIILELLQGFRGVAIHEQGRLPKPDPAKLRSAMQQKYMTADMEGMELKDKEEGPDFDGVAEMFK